MVEWSLLSTIEYALLFINLNYIGFSKWLLYQHQSSNQGGGVLNCVFSGTVNHESFPFFRKKYIVVMHPSYADGMANSVVRLLEQSDLGLHHLLRPNHNCSRRQSWIYFFIVFQGK